MLFDVFISHASEDKNELVRPLANALQDLNISVWYDEFSLDVGDSLRESIDRGLAKSRFGIVVLSSHFFLKQWPARELNGLVSREIEEGRKIILPIWHKIDRSDIVAISPTLADSVALNSRIGIENLATRLLHRIRDQKSALVVARDELVEKGLSPPPISDGWWLDVVEFKEATLRFPDTNSGSRWIFPLPSDIESTELLRGQNIASTALQLDWCSEAAERGISHLSHPEVVHGFIRDCPGLDDYARKHPGILALYAPQITLPGFDGGFADVFDALMSQSRKDAYQSLGYDKPELIEGSEPLCGELIAWRHPTHGNYAERELAYSLAHAHTLSYYRSDFNDFECLAWLLSDDSNWLPNALKSKLIGGMALGSNIGWSSDVMRFRSNAFANEIQRKSPSKFRYTRAVRADLRGLFAEAADSVGLSTSPEKLAERFIEQRFVEQLFESRKRRG